METDSFRLQGYHPLWPDFPDGSAINQFCNSTAILQNRPINPTTPAMQRLQAITHDWFGLFPVRSPLLGESLLFSLPEGTEMFHFPSFASAPYVFRC